MTFFQLTVEQSVFSCTLKRAIYARGFKKEKTKIDRVGKRHRMKTGLDSENVARTQ